MYNSAQLSDDEKMVSLNKLLSSCLISKNKETGLYEKEITHTKLSGGTYNISDDNYINFLNLYSSLLNNKKFSSKFDFIERPIEKNKMVGPFIIDIDYKQKSCERLYEKKHFERIIQICNELFIEYFKINKNSIKAYVLEKDSPTYEEEKKQYKDGFHIFYEIPMSCNKRLFFFDKMKKIITDEDVFSDIDHISNYAQIVDESVIINNGIMMYGCSKWGKSKYELTNIYNYNLVEDPVEEYTDNKCNLAYLFSLRQSSDEDDTPFNKNYKNEEEVLNSKNLREERKKTVKPVKNNNNNNNINYGENIIIPNLEPIKKKYEELFEYIDMLSPNRATGYDTWIKVCWALNGISNELLPFFLYFSKKAKNYDEKGCIKEWGQSNRNGAKLTISSIILWAKEDNIDKYRELYNTKLQKIIEKGIEEEEGISNFAYEMYRDSYVCLDIKKDIWLEFTGTKWKRIDSGYTLHNKLSSELQVELKNICSVIIKNIFELDGYKKDESKRLLTKFENLEKKLQKQAFTSQVMRSCARKFFVENFEETLDSNEFLIGFKNGVYDLKSLTFRNGNPDDRITFCVKYDYIEYNKNDPVLSEIKECIRKILPSDDVREYILRLFSSLLDGKNRDQKFHVFTGKGSNGKSIISKLLEFTLGDYADVLNSAVITTNDKDGNAASPELAQSKGKRLLSIGEPPSDQDLRTDKIKKYTGCDRIKARQLFGIPFTFVPQFKMILICNKLPPIPEKGHDAGIWRRMCVTPFESKFTFKHNEVDETKNIYLADTSLDDKLQEWAQPFMWILINEFYPKYIKSTNQGGGLQIPEKVLLKTEKYKSESDIHLEFLKHYYDITNDMEDREHIKVIYEQFKPWIRDYHTGSKIKVSKNEMRDNFVECQNLVEKGNYIHGIKLKAKIED